jgi:capsule polysaccharide export protein KpsE/RkpR
MNQSVTIPPSEFTAQVAASVPQDWLSRGILLWRYRRTLARVAAIAMVVSLGIAFVIPKQYKSIASIMPPDQQGSSTMLLAALAGRSGGLGSLGTLAGGLLGAHTNTALYESLLQSGTIGGRLIDRFNLQKVYGSRYRFTTAKHLARMTKITDDKKSGVITIAVEDNDPVRARDLAQAYLDELNNLLTRTSSSSARQERIFIESRLRSVSADLEDAQLALSEFSSKNSTIDLKEQTRGLVDAGARVQGELLVEQSGLQSLRQIYGDGNVRVRETEARIASLRQNLQKMAGTSAPLAATVETTSAIGTEDKGALYPSLRQLPRLAVPYANLYRRVRVQETVFELLTQQFEMARIEEAKDIPVVSVIDSPGVPEKKFFPPRLLLTVLLTSLTLAATAALILVRAHWCAVDIRDPRKAFAIEVFSVLRKYLSQIFRTWRGVA